MIETLPRWVPSVPMLCGICWTFASAAPDAGSLQMILQEIPTSYANPGSFVAGDSCFGNFMQRWLQETPWPLLTDRAPQWDPSRLVALGDTNKFFLFRTDITLRFKPSVSDSAKKLFFDRHQICVLGVTKSGRFFVRIPEPGTSVEALFKALDDLREEPEIAGAMWIPRSPFRSVINR